MEMDEIKTGMLAPDFSLPATGGSVVSRDAYRGRKIILFFYPKDNTAG
jgi:peroxiredoxin Q/BCP